MPASCPNKLLVYIYARDNSMTYEHDYMRLDQFYKNKIK